MQNGKTSKRETSKAKYERKQNLERKMPKWKTSIEQNGRNENVERAEWEKGERRNGKD